ncbi:mitochondrial carrier [Amylocystis lapponica]|nr:mitochondrial carrier [Amylocystis lapponica]
MIFDFIVVGSSTLVGILISVPLTGALVRLRANYNPKGLQLDTDGNVEPHTGPVVTSFFGMLKRVKRIEGWAGLYKGTMPTVLATSVLMLFTLLALNSSSGSYHTRADPPIAGPLGTLAFSIFTMLLSLPVVILTDRAITTPYRLPWLRPLYSLRVLLTPTERRKPWLLYTTPGLLLSQVLHIAYTTLVMRGIRWFLVPDPTVGGDETGVTLNSFRFGIYLGLEIWSTAILCPLEVISTKLSIQRNHAAPEYNSVEQEVEDDAVEGETYSEYSGAEEDVIGLRHEKDPYQGLLDCAKRVIDEEGWKALYRAWWLTMLAGITTALAFAARFFVN